MLYSQGHRPHHKKNNISDDKMLNINIDIKKIIIKIGAKNGLKKNFS